MGQNDHAVKEPRVVSFQEEFGNHAWWRHDMETIFALLALCEGNPSVTDGFPSQRTSNA